MACGSTDCGEIDECGVSGGNGPAYLCPNGETVCAESDCTYETQPTNCPPGDPTCDPSGDMYCPDGYYLDETIMECIEEEPEEGDPGTGNVPVFCEDSESWTTGNSATDYTNCPDWDFDNTCADGSLPGDNIGYVCPEDQPDYCNCTQIGVTWDDKSGQLVPNFVLVCNEGNPNNGEPCEYGDGGDDNDGTGLPQLGG